MDPEILLFLATILVIFWTVYDMIMKGTMIAYVLSAVVVLAGLFILSFKYIIATQYTIYQAIFLTVLLRFVMNPLLNLVRKAYDLD